MTDRLVGNDRLLRQDQLTLLCSTEAVDLAVVLDPDFVATAGESIEADDLW